jgi:hypothetical protein
MPGGVLRLDGVEGTWSTGSARNRVAVEHEGATLTVAVRCILQGLPFETQALLDTAATWSVIGGDLAEILAPQLGQP